jgi:hypothetical protein
VCVSVSECVCASVCTVCGGKVDITGKKDLVLSCKAELQLRG